MADLTYQPDRSGLDELGRSSPLQRFMLSQAETGATIARWYAETPASIVTSTRMDRARWRGVVTNTSDTALLEEYGVARPMRTQPTGSWTPANQPLGRVLDAARAADPRRGQRTS